MFKSVINIVIKYRLSMIAIILLLYLSFRNGEELNVPKFLIFEHADKFVHFIMYFGVASALFIDLVWLARRKAILIISAIIVALALLTEIGQEFFTYTRSGDIYDFLCNIAGGVTALILAPYTSKIYFTLKEYVRNFFR